MIEDVLSAWRTREGTALLAAYGMLVAAVALALPSVPQTAHAYAGAPLWLRWLPVAVPLALVAAVAVAPPLRALAYRLQMLSVGSFLVALVLILLTKKNGGTWLVVTVICLFSLQYAFLRWQELVASYGSVVAAFALLALAQHMSARTAIGEIEVLASVSLLSVALGSLRLRSLYGAANERFRLERQTAELRRQTERSARMAFTDHLTGLLNRAGINDLIDRTLALSRRGGLKTALLYLDLDGFKEINDTCGHDAGDFALVEAALRMQYLLRTGETAGRVGGDEFVVVLPSVRGSEDARALARRIEEAFGEPFHIGNRVFRLSASIGIACSGEHGESRADLVSAADKSMYIVKRWRKLAHASEHAHGGSGI